MHLQSRLLRLYKEVVKGLEIQYRYIGGGKGEHRKRSYLQILPMTAPTMVPVLAPESLFLEALDATDRLTPFVEDGRPEEGSTLLDASSVVDVVFPDFDFVPPEDVDVVDED